MHDAAFVPCARPSGSAAKPFESTFVCSRPIVAPHARGVRRSQIVLSTLGPSQGASSPPPATKSLNNLRSQPLLLFLSFLASSVGSLIGAGGGVLLTPFLTAFGLPQHNAHGTTLVVITANALISATKYTMSAQASVPVACALSFSAILTAPIGARYSAQLNGKTLKRYFGVVLILVSVLLPILPYLSSMSLPVLPLLLRLMFLFGVGSLTGFLTGLLGIGGGTVNVPVLVLLGFPQKLAQGTALLAMVVPSMRASVVHGTMGHVMKPLLPALILGAILGGLAGSSAAVVLPDVTLRYVCSVCFAGIGFRYLSQK